MVCSIFCLFWLLQPNLTIGKTCQFLFSSANFRFPGIKSKIPNYCGTNIWQSANRSHMLQSALPTRLRKIWVFWEKPFDCHQRGHRRIWHGLTTLLLSQTHSMIWQFKQWSISYLIKIDWPNSTHRFTYSFWGFRKKKTKTYFDLHFQIT